MNQKKKKLPWGHESRHCARCGKVGPRVFLINPPVGYVHFRCLTADEKRARRAEQSKPHPR